MRSFAQRSGFDAWQRSGPVARLFATLTLVLGFTACSPGRPVDFEATLLPREGVVASFEAREADRVLVVVNESSEDSRAIGEAYLNAREIPVRNLVSILTPDADDLPRAQYEADILGPVRQAVQDSESRIDYIVLTKGVPFRIREGGYSVDGHLAAMNLDLPLIRRPEPEQVERSRNPFFNSTEPFNSDRFNMYLVTRLDGRTRADALRLIENSLAAERQDGLFFFDQATNRNSGGYLQYNNLLSVAAEILVAKGFRAELEETRAFVAPDELLMGYASWGSNDSSFRRSTFQGLRFHPGAIAETFVSTSARTFRQVDGGQSVISDLIAAGVTGVKGYVSEPYLFAIAQPPLLFDRYTGGFNLAESFYAASPVLQWKDVVVGDPLCRPFARSAN